MPVGSVAARNAILDATLGSTQHASIPDPLFCALFGSDPMVGGVEISGNGYARVPVPKSSWGVAAGGEKTNTAPIEFAVSIGVWSSAVTHLALMSAATGGTMFDTGILGAPVTVGAPGIVVVFNPGQIIVSQF